MMVANGIMRGAGDTRTPMWNTLIMNVWNVVVSFVLIFGVAGLPALGIEGAAWGTSTARMMGGVLAVGALLRGRSPIRLDWRALFQWNGRIVQRILALAVPTAIEGSVAQSGYLLFTRMVASLGTATLAAHQIALRVESLSYMPSWGLAVAATTLVGQSLGARDPKLAEDAVKRTLVFSLIFNGLLGAVFVFFARPIVSVFGSTPEILLLAAGALVIAAAELPGLGIEMILAGGLRGAGDTRTPMIVTLVGVLLFRLSLVYLLAIQWGWGLAGVWWGTAIDWTMRALLLWIFFVRGRWKTIRMDEEE
jgi:putative MATE family efflux protein